MNISEIFRSIEGEGLRSGLPCTFIRLFGCNLRCSYCDSRYACEGVDYTDMTIEEIVEKVNIFNISRVTITGGEPLIQDDIHALITALLQIDGLEINIETNGSIPLTSIDSKNRENGRIIITMDWKSITSGMFSNMQYENLNYLTDKDVLKFVIGSHEDLKQMKQLIQNNDIKAQIFVSPVFGWIESSEIVKFILYENLDIRMQLQIHKIIWDPDKRGV